MEMLALKEELNIKTSILQQMIDKQNDEREQIKSLEIANTQLRTQIKLMTSDNDKAVAELNNSLKGMSGSLMAENKVKSALISQIENRDLYLNQIIKAAKSILRSPRLYSEFKKAQLKLQVNRKK